MTNRVLRASRGRRAGHSRSTSAWGRQRLVSSRWFVGGQRPFRTFTEPVVRLWPGQCHRVAVAQTTLTLVGGLCYKSTARADLPVIVGGLTAPSPPAQNRVNLVPFHKAVSRDP